MATPQIGSQSFIKLSGAAPSNPADRFEEITRPNADGHAYADIGKRGEIVQMTSEVDSTSVDTTVTAYRALIGTFVTVTLPSGRTVPQVFVLDVKTSAEEKKVLNPLGGVAGGSWIVRAAWILQGNSLS